ncbi:hypothetical protein [Qipengyuania qiaonensis]|uniref:DUF1217 domain-containing protein n=1 Tax=Qipengyuania qiaonensis TaxID=2867240 RepID=A0ABS7J864_9SPHN|nr:hypothetical protein [Qipengyuania qiaonensis]MBX7483497.1 hypothetical protein [Qipengyuania qiaonensis]
MSVEATTAANDIRQLTQDNGLLGTSRNGQMQEVRDILDGLSPADRNIAISQLSDADLQALADDVNAGGILGAQGLSADEKRDMFVDLARGLEGDQLARISEAFDDRADVIALGDAVATHATAEVKVDFVAATADRTTDNPTTDHVSIGSSYSQNGDADAVAIGSVIASLNGNASAVNRSLASLSDDQLQAVATAGAGQVNFYSRAGVSISLSPDRLTDFLDAAATASSAEQKGRAFEAGATTLNAIGQDTGFGVINPELGTTSEAIQASLTRILDADTNGVLRYLETADRTGGALSAYTTQTLSQDGGQEQIGRLIERVQQGNGLNQTPQSRFETLENGHYRNAQVMGYLSGAIQVGITKNAESAREQAELVTGIFSEVVGLGTGNLPGPVGSTIGVLTDQVMDQIVDELASSGDLSSAMYELTFPTDTGTSRPYEGPAEADYDSASSRVILANR